MLPPAARVLGAAWRWSPLVQTVHGVLLERLHDTTAGLQDVWELSVEVAAAVEAALLRLDEGQPRSLQEAAEEPLPVGDDVVAAAAEEGADVAGSAADAAAAAAADPAASAAGASEAAAQDAPAASAAAAAEAAPPAAGEGAPAAATAAAVPAAAAAGAEAECPCCKPKRHKKEKSALIPNATLQDNAEGDALKIEGLVPNLICILVLITCAGLAAGLTTGLLSIEPLEMAIKQRSGTVDEKRQARRILPIISRHHLLLVTLLLFNSLANEATQGGGTTSISLLCACALPIFLDNLLPAYQAVIMSVTLVLFFGEILPTAFFTGPDQLRIASSLTWVVWALMAVFSPVAWPIAKALDLVLGTEYKVVVWALMAVFSPVAWPIAKALDLVLGPKALDLVLGTEALDLVEYKRYSRAEIAALVEVQLELSKRDDNPNAFEQPLHADEVAIVHGVLQASEKTVADAMLTMDRVYSISMDVELDDGKMADLLAAGYSRVPVFEGADVRNIRGYLQFDDGKMAGLLAAGYPRVPVFEGADVRNIRGYLQVKKLIVLNPGDKRQVRTLVLRAPEVVGPNKSLLELLNVFQMGRTHLAMLLNVFQMGRTHLAIVSSSPKLTREALRHGLPLEGNARPIGIITMEDIFEEIIQEEIWDESDKPTSYMEAQAKATLLKYTQRKAHYRRIGRLPTVGTAVSLSNVPIERTIARRLSRQSLMSAASSHRSRSRATSATTAGGGTNNNAHLHGLLDAALGSDIDGRALEDGLSSLGGSPPRRRGSSSYHGGSSVYGGSAHGNGGGGGMLSRIIGGRSGGGGGGGGVLARIIGGRGGSGSSEDRGGGDGGAARGRSASPELGSPPLQQRAARDYSGSSGGSGGAIREPNVDNGDADGGGGGGGADAEERGARAPLLRPRRPPRIGEKGG
ncbi:hypothetical protein JKP88DRAFT_346455 [Tribonema minus]|uniref:CNNM transmembrane domain-containing protein n=1 Tax=Tribonema minus TaxID=303371 RepID=A0A835ZJ67_9STRA|nr:hypothetical protein JKP88DRAFT_346455 [Tribonema minus]